MKNDTEANWNKSVLIQDGGTKESGTSFIPLKGEVIIYSTDDSHPFSRLKIGDGSTNVVNLPFIESAAINGNQIIIKTTTEWQSQLNYVPKKGEILVYTDKQILNNNKTVAGVKIGDGMAYCIDLPFIGDDIAENLLIHIQDATVHITQEERNFWNSKLNCQDIVEDEILILNRS